MKPRLIRRPEIGALGVALVAAVAVVALIAASSPTSVTAAQAQYAPVNTSAPTIAGTAVENGLLTANDGTWANQPNSFAYLWQRCDQAGNGCTTISGQTGKTYRVQTADIGKTMRVQVTAANNDGKSTVTSGQTAVVVSAGPAGAVKLASGETSIPVSSVGAGLRLVIAEARFSPNPVRIFSQAPISVAVRVKDSRGYVVRGALVFVRSTPEVTSTPPEQITGQDGWVTLTTVPQADFPKDPNYNVQVYVRARKTGEDPLGGVSTRRLVQFGLTR